MNALRLTARRAVLAALWLAIGACAAQTPPGAQDAAPPPSRVLFVGNSFTYYNDSLHKHLRQLTRAVRPEFAHSPRMRIMTISGARLVEHSAAFETMVASQPWDVVVLQGHSLEAFEEPTRAEFHETARRFDRIVRDAGARTALFMTWAYEGREEMTGVIAQQYTTLGQEIDALVVPVGLAFARVTREHPDIVLRHADLKHPTLAGTYLAACVFYARFYNMTPVGNPYLAGLDPVTARRLQEAAWESVRCGEDCGAAMAPASAAR